MKRFLPILIFVLAFFSSLQVTAQGWCKPGATWNYYTRIGVIGVDLNIVYKYTGDITINNQTYNVITGTLYGYDAYTYGYMVYKVIPNYASHYIRVDNSVLYDGPDTLVNFNASPGDQWKNNFSNYGCESLSKNIVKDTGHVIISGVSLKTVTVQCIMSDSVYYTPPIVATRTLNQVFTERFITYGTIYDHGANIFRQRCYDFNSLYEIGNLDLKCYYDDTGFIKSYPGYDCYDITSVPHHVSDFFMRVFPNPGNGTFYLNLSSKGKVNLFDTFGKAVFSNTFEAGDNQLNLHSIPNGMYIIQVENKWGVFTSKLVKE